MSSAACSPTVAPPEAASRSAAANPRRSLDPRHISQLRTGMPAVRKTAACGSRGILYRQATKLHSGRAVTGLAQPADHPRHGEQHPTRDTARRRQPAELYRAGITTLPAHPAAACPTPCASPVRREPFTNTVPCPLVIMSRIDSRQARIRRPPASNLPDPGPPRIARPDAELWPPARRPPGRRHLTSGGRACSTTSRCTPACSPPSGSALAQAACFVGKVTNQVRFR